MRDGRLEASGHNWVEGQGSGPRIDKQDGEEEATYDAMGNKIDNKKNKKLTSSEQRKVRFAHVIAKAFVEGLFSCSSRRNVLHGKSVAKR